MFSKFLAAAGIGNATLDARPHSNTTTPGGTLQGVLTIRGGKVEQTVSSAYVDVVTNYIEEKDGATTTYAHKLGSFRLETPAQLAPGQSLELPFRIELPLSTPLTMGGQRVWLQSGLDVQGGVDPSDKDELDVRPTPLQMRVFEGLERLGFHLNSSRCERAHGGHGLPFVQEFEMKPRGGPFSGRLDEVDVVMRPSADGLDVLFEVDRKASGLGGWLNEAAGTDERRLTVQFSSHEADAHPDEWERRLHDTLAPHA